MEHRRFVKLREEPRRLEAAAAWFHQKWGIPQEAYRASMEECLTGQAVPQWYLAVEGERILGGLGVIANDFHPRRDLSPNLCAVYVEEDARCQGIAGALLGLACRDMAQLGYPHFVPADGPHRLLRALRLGVPVPCAGRRRGAGQPDVHPPANRKITKKTAGHFWDFIVFPVRICYNTGEEARVLLPCFLLCERMVLYEKEP